MTFLTFYVFMQNYNTLGPTYSKFGYYEHPSITSNFFSLLKRTLLIDINVKQIQIQLRLRVVKSSVTTSTVYNEQIIVN